MGFGILESIMANKHKKKRNKPYRGQDASAKTPTVTRIQAVNRNRFSQWWHEKRNLLKPLLIAGGIGIGLLLIIVEIVRIMGGS